MNCGEVQVIILLEFWHETIYSYVDHGKPFLVWKTLMAAEKPSKTAKNLKTAEKPLRLLENLQICGKTLRFCQEPQKNIFLRV